MRPSEFSHFSTEGLDVLRRVMGKARQETVRRILKVKEANPEVVLDPFAGTGTTGIVALREGRRFLGVELNPAYAAMAEKRSREVTPSLFLAAGGDR